MMPFINFNGEFFTNDQPILTISNRAFCYGDGLFESMRWHNQKLLFAADHYERIKEGMFLLKMKHPDQFSISFLLEKASDLIKKNNFSGDIRLRLQIFRNEGGYYTPVDNTTSYVLTAQKIETENYSLNKKGLTIGIFNDFKKNNGSLSNFKTVNSSIYTLAGLWAKENNLDECLIVNHNNVITDAISSNVFIVKEKVIITTPVTEGCVNGIMRKNILKILYNLNYSTEEKPVREVDILTADEIFFTNISRGIQWVEKFKEKTYLNNFSEILFKNFLIAVG